MSAATRNPAAAARERRASSDDADAQLRAPIVVVGPLRAGTTLLRLMLGSHPQIAVFGEFEEAVEWAGDEGWPDPREYVIRLRQHRAFLAKELTPREELGSYPEIVRDLARQLAGRTTKPNIGWCIHSRFDRAPELWPDARYVHITRDPRDVARSCVGMGWAGTVWHAAPIWLRTEERVERLKARVGPDRIVHVRYEDLLRDPAGELGRICCFLGLPYDEAMLGFHLGSTYEPIDPGLAEQWRTRLPPREAELVELVCAPLMPARGYARSNPAALPPGPAERLRLALRNRTGKTRFRIRRYGLGLTLAWAAARRLPPANGFRRACQLRINEINAQHLK